MLGSDCGGNFVYLENGIKDCSSCDIPHRKDFGYEYVQKKLRLYVESVKNM
jgi:Zn-finger protein